MTSLNETLTRWHIYLPSPEGSGPVFSRWRRSEGVERHRGLRIGRLTTCVANVITITAVIVHTFVLSLLLQTPNLLFSRLLWMALVALPHSRVQKRAIGRLVSPFDAANASLPPLDAKVRPRWIFLTLDATSTPPPCAKLSRRWIIFDIWYR